MSDKPAPTDTELRKDIEVATSAYDRSKTYYNAVGIQKAKNHLSTRIEARRKALRVVEGDGGDHDFSDIEIMGQALGEIFKAIARMKSDDDIPGTLLHCYNVSKHALMSTGKLDE